MDGPNILRRYVPGNSVDDTLIWYEGSGLGTPNWLHADEQGTVIVTTNGSGAATQYVYSATGEPTSWGGARFRYTGQAALPAIALYYYKARMYDPHLGRFLQTDPVGYTADYNLYTYVGNDPVNRVDSTGLCADHYEDGSCMVNVDPGAGPEGAEAAKKLEGVLNAYDKKINSLSDKANINVTDREGKVIGSISGKEYKAIWNGTSFSITTKKFDNGGGGGGTGGKWLGSEFRGRSELNPSAVASYGGAAISRKEAESSGISTLIFHELGHETYFGESLTQKYPVTPVLSWPRELGTSSAGRSMAGAAGAPFICSIPGGCQ